MPSTSNPSHTVAIRKTKYNIWRLRKTISVKNISPEKTRQKNGFRVKRDKYIVVGIIDCSGVKSNIYKNIYS
jgi:hypothetical protein